MAVSLETLKPYKSLLVCQSREGRDLREAVVGIIGEIEGLVRASGTREMRRPHGDPHRENEMGIVFAHYVEKRHSSWTTAQDVLDVVNHLILVCASQRYVAILLTDPPILDKVYRRVGTGDGGTIGGMGLVPAGVLNAAFVKGETQTLWLSGAHRRVASKVDNKIIYGLDVRYALDPLGDQTYYFTAARSRIADPSLRSAVGVTPRRARVWAGPTKDWRDFTTAVGRILDLLEQKTRRPDRAPFPVLALPAVDARDIRAVRNAYDAVLAPPELLDPEIDRDEREGFERWARYSFQVRAGHGADFDATVNGPDDNGVMRKMGVFRFQFDLSVPTKPTWTVTLLPKGEGTGEVEDLERTLKSKGEWLKVWYESGHTLTNGGFVSLRYRDQPFENFLWMDFGGYDVGKEKPSPLNRDTVGQQDSLFCWVKGRWRTPGRGRRNPQGYLACDDGPGEIADFIQLDTGTKPPTLALIHVKASKGTGRDRPISVSDYEIVTGQAVKNLRFLDHRLAGRGLAEGLAKRISTLVWRNGRHITRQEFTKALNRLGTNYQRLVVILQPRVTQRAVKAARGAPESAEGKRLRQLDTLLLGARASCQALGATLWVVGEA